MEPERPTYISGVRGGPAGDRLATAQCSRKGTNQMTVHTRRAALAALATAAAATPLLVATHAALPQTAPAAPTDPQAYKDYVEKTLTIAALSTQASQIAVDKATDEMVKEFAGLELAEAI